ncbi:MAG: hypothetical protein IT207_05740 [Fimbriimonadaceae bacterium]|nr:hypothetical protein [Fimbriimonadaceae bacterium]
MTTARSTFVLSLFAIAAISTAQDARLVRIKVNPGSKLSTVSTSTTKMTFSGAMDESMDSTTSLSQVYSFEPAADEKTKFTLNTTEFKIEGGMAEQMGGGDTNSVKKATLSGLFDARGLTSDIVLAGVQDGDMLATMVMIQPREMYKQIGFFGFAFPEEPVSVGSKWESKLNFADILAAQSMGFLQNAKGEIPVQNEVIAFETVDGIECAKIKSFLDGKVTFDVAAPGMESSGNMTMTGVTNAWFSLADGLLVKSESSSASVIDMGMMTINQASETKTTAKRS